MNVKGSVRWTMVSAALAGVVTAVNVTSSNATQPVGLSQVLLGRGTNVSTGTLPLHVGDDVAVAQITVQPGGSSGWHSHPGGAIIVVKEGAVTVYRALGSQCQVNSYRAGQAFIERPGELDQVINTGTVPYVLVVTFPRIPQGAPPRDDHPDPGLCSGL